MARDNYVKVQLRLRSHPAVIERDHSVDHVFTLALRIAREQDGDGTLRAACFTNRYLRRYFDLPDDLPDSYLDRGRAGCFEGGILRADGDRVVVPGWIEEYGEPPATGAERTAGWRERRKRATDGGPGSSGNGSGPGGGHSCDGSDGSDGAASLASRVTEARHGVTCDGRGEERRGEERRREERSSSFITRAREAESDAPFRQDAPPPPHIPDGFERVETHWRMATPSQPLLLGGVLSNQVLALVTDFGADVVNAAVDEQVATTGKTPSPKYVRKVCESMRGGMSKPSTSAAPVIEPRYYPPPTPEQIEWEAKQAAMTPEERKAERDLCGRKLTEAIERMTPPDTRSRFLREMEALPLDWSGPWPEGEMYPL